MSKTKNPIELVDRYLQAVRFWTPKTRKLEELLAELGDDLCSQIEDKETQLGRPVSPEEVSEILKRCGSPMAVASRLGPRRSLIGPAIFPVYTFVLKMVLLWILVPVFLFILGPINIANANGDWRSAIVETGGQLWSGLFIAAGIVTLIFAILERTHAIADINCKWDPQSLPPLQKTEQKTSMVKAACQLGFAWIGLTWILLLPHYPFLIFGSAAAFLRLGPFWQPFYLPIVLLSAFGLLRYAFILAKPHWVWLPPVSELVSTALALLLLHFILNSVGQAPASMHSFVVLTDSAKNSVQYIKVAAIVNVSILVAMASAWLGLCIAGVIQVWEVMQYIRRQRSSLHQPAELQVR